MRLKTENRRSAMFKTILSVLGVLFFLTPANAAGPEVTGRIEMEKAPVSMAYDGKTGKLFMATDGGRILVLDGKSGKVTKTLQAKGKIASYLGGNGVSLNTVNGRLYAPADKKGVFVFDIKSGKATKRIGEKKERDDYAMAVAVNQKDNSYVTVDWSGYVSVYDGAKDILKSEFPLDFKGRNYFALSPDGDTLFISLGSELLKISLKDKMIKRRIEMDGLSAPLVDQAGNLFLGGKNDLYMMDKEGVVSRASLGSRAAMGAALALNPKTGHLFIPLEDGKVAVIKIAATGMEVIADIEVGPAPKGAVVVGDKVYVARGGGITVLLDRGE